jgi:MFS family permease
MNDDTTSPPPALHPNELSVDKSATASEPAAAQAQTTAPPRVLLQSLGQLRIFEALHYREYRLIRFGQIFASLATWMDQVARGWLLYELTNSTLQLGLVRGVQAIPKLLLSPVAGSAADRYSRKNQILVAQIVDGLLYVIVAILIFAGRIEPWHVYVTAFGMSVVQAFQQPARAAMVGDAVPTAHITNAIGLNLIFPAACYGHKIAGVSKGG